jgi:hypothetical protein
MPLWLSIAIGVVVFLVVVLARQRHHTRVWWGPRPETPH